MNRFVAAAFAEMDGLGMTENRYFPAESELEKLSAEEQYWVEFNIFAMLFGPFYYLFMGMWLKGLCLVALTAISLLFGLVLTQSGLPNPSIRLEWLNIGIVTTLCVAIPFLLCALLANYDRYRQWRFNESFWPLFAKE